MLVKSMTNEEVIKEMVRDWEETILPEMGVKAKSYIKIRKKYKIDKRKDYLKKYLVTSKLNNKWVIMIRKSSSCRTYKAGSEVALSYTYYYTNKGLRVLKIIPNKNGIEVTGIGVYNGHLFTRYNERMKLDIIKPLDIVYRYFSKNVSNVGMKKTAYDPNEFFVKCKEGYLFGRKNKYRIKSKNLIWAEYKTFISHNEPFLDQEINGKKLIKTTEEIYPRMLKIKGSLGLKETQYLKDLYADIVN